TPGAGDAAVLQVQLVRRAVIEDAYLGAAQLVAHEAQVVRAPQGAVVALAGLGDRKAVAQLAHQQQLAPGGAEDGVGPRPFAQAATAVVSLLEMPFVLRRIRYVPDVIVRRGRRSRSTAVALVGKDHAGAGAGGLEGRPDPGRATAQHQHVRAQRGQDRLSHGRPAADTATETSKSHSAPACMHNAITCIYKSIQPRHYKSAL